MRLRDTILAKNPDSSKLMESPLDPKISVLPLKTSVDTPVGQVSST